MKTQRKDQHEPAEIKSRKKEPNPQMTRGGFGEDEDYDPREADLDDDDDSNSGKREYHDYDSRHKSKP